MLVAVVLSLGLAVLSAGLPLVLPLVLLAGLVAEAAGVALGEADLVALCEGDGEGLGHAVTFALAWLLWDVARTGTASRGADLLARSVRALGSAAAVEEEEANPTAVPSWTKACRSGGTARATPMANTAQAAARPDRSKPTRQSRG